MTDATLAVVAAALKQAGAPDVRYDDITAGAALFAETGLDIEADGETRAGAADAIFLGAIGLPSVRHTRLDRSANSKSKPELSLFILPLSLHFFLVYR